MKILYIQHEEKLWGTSRSLIDLIDEMRQQGHQCYVLLRKNGPIVPELDTRKIPYTLFHWRVWRSYGKDGRIHRLLHGVYCILYNRFNFSKVLKQIENFKPDLIHSNTIKTNVGGCLAKRLGIPHIWHIREFVDSRYGVETVWSLGCRATTMYMARHGAAVICISHALHQEFAQSSLHIPIYVVYNGVMRRAQMLEAVSSLDIVNGDIHFAFIGRFDALKDPLTVLQALAILQRHGITCKLVMAGDGCPEKKEMLQNFVREHALENRVEFPGYVSDISALLKRIHVLVMPSRGDAFGRVTAEAMAHGRPVIGADACATPELVRDGVDGLIFAPGDAEALADKMQILIDSPAMMAEMGRNAAQRAQEKFTNEQYAAAIMDIYERVSQCEVAA